MHITLFFTSSNQNLLAFTIINVWILKEFVANPGAYTDDLHKVNELSNNHPSSMTRLSSNTY